MADDTPTIDAQIELTRINLQKLLAELEADYEVENPEKSARLAALAGGEREAERYKELAERSDAKRRGEALQDIMKGVAAAAEAAGARNVKALHKADDDGASGLDAIAEGMN